MPDALLGEARVNLSEQSLGDSTVAGSGGGAHVQVCLRGLTLHAVFRFACAAEHLIQAVSCNDRRKPVCDVVCLLLMLAADFSRLQKMNGSCLALCPLPTHEAFHAHEDWRRPCRHAVCRSSCWASAAPLAASCASR